MKRIGFVLVILLWCEGCSRVPPVPSRPAPPNVIATIAQIKQAVIPVVCVQLPRTGGSSELTLVSVEGTAFFVSSDGTFATAGHVVRDLTARNRRAACEQAAIYVPEGGWQPNVTNFKVQYFFFSTINCTRDDSLDIAICRSPRNIKEIMGTYPPSVTLETSPQKDGTPAAFTGFPLQFVLPITSRGFIATYRDTRDETGPRELVIDKAAWPGASGSPIYLENGHVIGILLDRGVGEAVGIAFGRPASFIERLLAQRKQAQQK